MRQLTDLYVPNDVRLQTPRLILEPLRTNHASAFAALLGPDPGAIAMLSHMPEPLTAKAAAEWIELRTGPGGHVFAAETFPGNRASERVLAKLGFVPQGPVERHYPLRGGWRRLTFHSLKIG